MIIFDKDNRFDKKNSANINALQRKIKALFDDFNTEAIQLGVASKFASETAMFSFADYPALNKKINALMESLSDAMVETITVSEQTAFELSDRKNTYLIDTYAAINPSLAKKAINSSVVGKKAIAEMKQRNLEAWSAFQDRKINGLELSDRIWSVVKQAKTEVELTLDTGLSQGASAAQMARDIKQYLVQPDKLFRRVRDKHGNLNLSKPAKAYHPGQGVYRSSYRNALRVAGTETNIAYHTADYNSWINNDLVIGVEIRTSETNHPIEDICDDLAGIYPKEFEFVGWHPSCRCHATPITPNNSDFANYIKLDCPSDYNFKGTIVDLPSNFSDWVDKNTERIDGMKKRGTLPYFLKQNSSLIK